MTDLQNIENLKRACVGSQKAAEENENYVRCGQRLHDFLTYVRDADAKTRASEEFQRRIWEENPVTAVGMGTIPVEGAISDPDFRKWLAEQSLRPLPQAAEARAVALDEMFEELQERMGQYTKRTPRLKIYRVLGSFFPTDFTTLSHVHKLRRLQMAMFGHRKGGGPSCHLSILARVREAIGSHREDLDAIVKRMRLPWLLFKDYVAATEDEKTESTSEVPGEESLVPLSAARRRRGLTGVTGGFQAALNILESCRDGVSREDLKSHIRTVSPKLKDSSIATQINVLISEFNCLKWKEDQYVLTDRGHALLESGDPVELMDWLITRILGVDHVLVILRHQGPTALSEVVERIQKVNPGWTSNWAPSVMLNELRAFGMLERDDNRVLSLTDAGSEWASRIDWEPEVLVREISPEVSAEVEEEPADADDFTVALPAFSEILKEVSRQGHFPESLIERLHAGIWANRLRHFAILTGLSGSGKTLLARAYGKAIVGRDELHAKHLCTIPVQPGWYDPTSLLGYVNPLQAESYMRTEFLEFLLAAAEDPTRPYSAVLDEMNLSHPEQYLAPILSAMETGAPLSLHREGERLDGVPSKVRYPSNLVIIGTVNMDETTHGISDKVLDRAFTIEFWNVNLNKYPRWGQRDLSSEHESVARGSRRPHVRP